MLASCKDETSDSNKPGGQTIVTVNGEDITIHQLNSSLAKIKVPANISEQQFNAAKAKVVDSLISRELFVQQALKRDMDRKPKYLKAIQEAKKAILMTLYLESQLKSMSVPDKSDISHFYQQRPELFLDRKVYKVLEIDTDNSINSEIILRQIKKNLQLAELSEDLPAWLKSKSIKFNIKPWIKASEKIENHILIAIYPHKVNDVVLVKQGNVFRFIKLIDVKSKPVSEQDAAALIKSYIANNNKAAKIKDISDYLKTQARIIWSDNYSELNRNQNGQKSKKNDSF